ncbi:hypothetical protein IWQ56_004667 [Coemansia nantahalensis]|nr:hypothetical protein IWQ56_004667 [Coemansia nantahalensis]
MAFLDPAFDEATCTALAPPKRFRGGNCAKSVTFKSAAGISAEDALADVHKATPGNKSYPLHHASGQFIRYCEEALASRAAAVGTTVAGERAEAYRPVQRTAQMATVTLRFSYVGSAVEVARYLEAALNQYGTILDIVLRILDLNMVCAQARVIIDRAGQEGDIPAVIEHEGKRMTLIGDGVAPFCVYCYTEGHTKLECSKWLRRQGQNHRQQQW